jgi:CBS-domain-containing membrane protein
MIRDRRWYEIVVGAGGAAAAIAIMEFLSTRTAFPLASIPFATSIVLVMGAPDAPPAQPRGLFGGHVVSAVVGILTVKLLGPQPWAAALAVGLAIVAMHVTGTFHPPAGINPLLIVVNNLSWPFLAVPVAAGAVLLVGFAWLWHNALRRERWPQRWL